MFFHFIILINISREEHHIVVQWLIARVYSIDQIPSTDAVSYSTRCTCICLLLLRELTAVLIHSIIHINISREERHIVVQCLIDSGFSIHRIPSTDAVSDSTSCTNVCLLLLREFTVVFVH